MDLQVARMKNFVRGEFVEARRGEWELVIDPATGETLAEVPRCTEEDVDRAVEAASGVFEGWFDTTPQDRSEDESSPKAAECRLRPGQLNGTRRRSVHTPTWV